MPCSAHMCLMQVLYESVAVSTAALAALDIKLGDKKYISRAGHPAVVFALTMPATAADLYLAVSKDPGEVISPLISFTDNSIISALSEAVCVGVRLMMPSFCMVDPPTPW